MNCSAFALYETVNSCWIWEESEKCCVRENMMTRECLEGAKKAAEEKIEIPFGDCL